MTNRSNIYTKELNENIQACIYLQQLLFKNTIKLSVRFNKISFV